MPLKYQNQDSEQTLREAIAEYHQYLTDIGRQILTDRTEDADTIWLYHDATHAIFGQDTTIEDEAALDFWVFFGTTFSWRLLKQYQQIPEIKDLSRAILSELGIMFIPLLYWRNKRVLWTVIRNTRRMNKKWPFELPATLLDRRLSELREEYGITVLTSEQKVPSRLTEFDYSIVGKIS